MASVYYLGNPRNLEMTQAGIRRSLSYATLKVAHYGDILTDFTARRNAVLLLHHLSLIEGYSHIILQIMPSKKDVLDEFMDAGRSYIDVKYAEALNAPGLPQIVVLVKKNYGVLKAIHKVGGVRAGPVVVERGFKYFPVFVPRYRESELIKHVVEFSPCPANVRLLRSRTTCGSVCVAPSLSVYESQILRVALEEGYFEWPRRTRLEELASRMGISKATAAEHLRRALKKLLMAYIAAPQLMRSG